MPDFKIETGKFQFIEEPMAANEDEFGAMAEGFEDEGGEIADKTEVLICTTDYRMRGKVALVPGARLTDYIVESKPFIAVTDAEVFDKQGHLLMRTPFLDINRDHIVLIAPADLTQVNA